MGSGFFSYVCVYVFQPVYVEALKNNDICYAPSSLMYKICPHPDIDEILLKLNTNQSINQSINMLRQD